MLLYANKHLPFPIVFKKRFFPDFFPSCYTEQRLNLRKLYREIERKSDEDLLGLDIEPLGMNSIQNWFSDISDRIVAAGRLLIFGTTEKKDTTSTLSPVVGGPSTPLPPIIGNDNKIDENSKKQ